MNGFLNLEGKHGKLVGDIATVSRSALASLMSALDDKLIAPDDVRDLLDLDALHHDERKVGEALLAALDDPVAAKGSGAVYAVVAGKLVVASGGGGEDALEHRFTYLIQNYRTCDRSHDWHCRRLRELAAKRRAYEAAVSLGSDALESVTVSPSELVARFRAVADEVEGTDQGELIDLADVMTRLVDRMESGEEMRSTIRTPWPSLSGMMQGGLGLGEVTVVAARPSVGKSLVAMHLARTAVMHSQTPTLLVSLEMNEEQIAQRMLAAAAGCPMSDMTPRNATSHAKGLRDAIEWFRSPYLRLAAKTGKPMTVSDIRRLAKSHPAGPAKLVIVDYLQLLSPTPEKGKAAWSREREVAADSRALKQMALEMGAAVVVLSQLNRASETENREPTMADLRESGAIEQDADNILLLHAPKLSDPVDVETADRAGTPLKVTLAKGRSVGVGEVWLVRKGAMATVATPPQGWTPPTETAVRNGAASRLKNFGR